SKEFENQYFAVVNSEIIVMGDSRAAVVAALEREADGTPANLGPALAARLRRLDPRSSAWTFFGPELIPLFDAKGFSDEVEDFHVEVQLTEELTLAGVVTVKDADRADQVLKQFRTALAELKKSLGAEALGSTEAKDAAEVREFFDSIKIERRGK